MDGAAHWASSECSHIVWASQTKHQILPWPHRKATDSLEAFDQAMKEAIGAGSPTAEHFTPKERASIGKQARRQAPLESHAEWAPSVVPIDPIAFFEEQAETRLPELVPIRHGRMIVSPFTFLSGRRVHHGRDLAATPRSGLRVQACGDAHLSNFGIFASPDVSWCSTSTTSTRRWPPHGSGTSSGWRRASWLRAGTGASRWRCGAPWSSNWSDVSHGRAPVRRDEEPRRLVRQAQRGRPPGACRSGDRQEGRGQTRQVGRGRPGARTAYGRSKSWPSLTGATRASSATRRYSCPSASSCPRSNTSGCWTTCAPSYAPTAGRCRATAETCCNATAWSTPRARWWAWVA